MSDPSEVLIHSNQSSLKGYFCFNPSLSSANLRKRHFSIVYKVKSGKKYELSTQKKTGFIEYYDGRANRVVKTENVDRECSLDGSMNILLALLKEKISLMML